jgi:hypothetical protein
MNSNISTSLLKIETLLSNQNSEQNAMLLIFGNMERINETSFIRLIIDNPYIFLHDDIKDAASYMAMKILNHTHNKVKMMEKNQYFESHKYCLLLWLCCICMPLENLLHLRVKTIFSKLADCIQNLPKYFIDQISCEKLNENERKEIIQISKYMPSFTKDFHNINYIPNVDLINLIKEPLDNKIKKQIWPPNYDEAAKTAVFLSAYIPLRILDSIGKNIHELSPRQRQVLYIFCLISLHVVSFLLNLDSRPLTFHACLSLFENQIKKLLCDEIIESLNVFNNDFTHENKKAYIEAIKNKIKDFLFIKNDQNIKELVQLYINY